MNQNDKKTIFWSATWNSYNCVNNWQNIIQQFAIVNCKCLIYGEEKAPTTGRDHLQFYCILRGTHGKSRNQLKKLCYPGIHWEPSRRSAIANIIYCSKEKKYWMHCDSGFDPLENNKKGKTQKFDEAKELAIQGKLDEIDSEIYIKHKQNLEKIFMSTIKVIDQNWSNNLIGDCFHNHSIWIHGDTGLGKSYRAVNVVNYLELFWADFRKHHPEYPENYFIPKVYKKGRNKWWDYYEYEDIVIIEELDPKCCEYMTQAIKIWTDQYTFPVEVKQGGFKAIRPKFFIFTSNYSMKECFPNKIDLDPLKRRIKEYHITTKFDSIYWPNLNKLNMEWLATPYLEQKKKKLIMDNYEFMLKTIDWNYNPSKDDTIKYSNALKNTVDISSPKNIDKNNEFDPTIRRPDTNKKTIIIDDDDDDLESLNLPSMTQLFNNAATTSEVIDRDILSDEEQQSSQELIDEAFNLMDSMIEEDLNKYQNAYDKLRKGAEKDWEKRKPNIITASEPHEIKSSKGKRKTESQIEFEKKKLKF